MKLWLLAVVLGTGYALLQLQGLMRPGRFQEAWQRFPRSLAWGWALMIAATAWFLWNLHREDISDFAAFKPALSIGFAAIGLGSCVVLKDYLAVRGMAILWLLLAKIIVDAARPVATEWRLILVVWAYLLVVGGMWLTVSPWRFRDWIEWCTATERRLRLVCGVRLLLGLGLTVLGVTVFRGA